MAYDVRLPNNPSLLTYISNLTSACDATACVTLGSVPETHKRGHMTNADAGALVPGAQANHSNGKPRSAAADPHLTIISEERVGSS